MLDPLELEEDDFEEPDTVPVTTWSPGWRPETTCVLSPSEMPVTTGTTTGDPFRNTDTVLFDEIAAFGTSTALSAAWVMMVMVAVMSGSSCTSVGSTAMITLYVTTLELVVPAGSIARTVPVNVRDGYAV